MGDESPQVSRWGVKRFLSIFSGAQQIVSDKFTLHAKRRWSDSTFARTLECEACVELNLAPCADRREYSADVISEMACHISKHGVSVPSESDRILRITGNGKIRMIQEIEGFCSKHDLCLSGKMKGLTEGQVKLPEARSLQRISSSIAELTRRR